MKITSWNVNSLNVRLTQVNTWLQQHQPDILALQEIKLDQNQFPEAIFRLNGWQTQWYSQKAYNGVALISRHSLQNVQYGLPNLENDPQRRVISATIKGIRVINVYCVNGEALDSSKFEYKRQWFNALIAFIRDQLRNYPELILLGDFNIAPSNHDVYDPKKWHEKIHCSSEERQWFQHLLDLGLYDGLRQIYPNDTHYTWWDYRGGMFAKGLGLRIDHILISHALTQKLTDVRIDTQARAHERPSDHAPISAIFNY